MAKNLFIRLISVLLLVVILCGCASESSSTRPQLITDFTEAALTHSYAAQPSATVNLTAEDAETVLAALSQIRPDYFCSDLYELEEVKKRLDFEVSVETHQYSALNAQGALDAQHLAALVKQNNKDFLATKPFGYKAVEDDYIADLCNFIVRIVELMREKHPGIDWARVYCNLGNLKILYDTGMLSYAQVSEKMILSISKNNTEIILNMKGADGFTRVLTHEIMHIIQIGCVCEQIENCTRRAGICMYWDDFTLNTADWTWMVEGAAERNMCLLTGGSAVTYQYKMDYLCSLEMSVLLQDSVKADTMDTLCFYSDPELLFDAFGCQTQAQRDELLNMMITLQVLQMQPESFHLRYKEETGIDLMADEEAMNRFSYSLKPAICITLAKEFYENLVAFVQRNALTYHDVFFLINLFEGQINQHLTYTNESKAETNAPFLDAYRPMRTAFFNALQKSDPESDVAALYAAYDITASGKNLLNAELETLDEEKRAFLAERAMCQTDTLNLGQKVPQ